MHRAKHKRPAYNDQPARLHFQCVPKDYLVTLCDEFIAMASLKALRSEKSEEDRMSRCIGFYEISDWPVSAGCINREGAVKFHAGP